MQEPTDNNVVNVSRDYYSVKEKIEIIGGHEKRIPKIELTDKQKQLLRKLEIEHEMKMKSRELVTPQRKMRKIEIQDQKCMQTSDKDNHTEEKQSTLRPIIKPKYIVSDFSDNWILLEFTEILL